MSDPNPFKGRLVTLSPATRVLYRFTKPGGHWAEIRERTVTQFRALEFLVFVDGSLLESQMFQRGREADYPAAIGARVKQFTDGEWIQTPVTDDVTNA